ncbi:hypothetical protein CDAR_187501 [Caerostris darwini]|uniref:Uncharacterized protein n=1 Tax=Caerostris darwini TaxID=1538125 RepID=A0AAV4MR18_9ARAC|nr:hypothetical protein CDAR_187501 [Caerostris darwini]
MTPVPGKYAAARCEAVYKNKTDFRKVVEINKKSLNDEYSAVCIIKGRAYAAPTTKNYAPQATAVCGCGERQPDRSAMMGLCSGDPPS